MRTWKRFANGHGYCAVRVEDGIILPWTYSTVRKYVKRNISDWLGEDAYAKEAHRFRIVRCIVALAQGGK